MNLFIYLSLDELQQNIIKILCVIHLFISPIYSVSSLFQPISTAECIEFSNSLWRFVHPFSKDTPSLCIIFSRSSVDAHVYQEKIQCILSQNGAPVSLFDEKSVGNILNEGSVDDDFLEHYFHNYILIVNTVTEFDYALSKLYDQNSNTRNVFALIKSTDDIESLLKIAWNKYKMLNIILVHFNTNREEPYNQTNIKIDISFYDPFVKFQATRGKIYTFSAQKEEIGELANVAKELIERRLYNLHQISVKVGVIDFPGFMEPLMDDNGNIIKYVMPYGDTINLIVEAMNFKAIFTYPPDVREYGAKLRNGTFIGLFGILEREEVEFVANLRVLADSDTFRSTFTPMVAQTSLNFITPNNQPNKLGTFTSIFNTNSCIALSITYLLIISVKYILHRLYHNYIYDMYPVNFDLMHNFMETFATILLLSFEQPELRYHRCIFVVTVFMFTIINYLYQGNMVRILATDTISVNINTLEEIARSDLKILVPYSLATFSPFLHLDERKRLEVEARFEFLVRYGEGIERVAYERDSTYFVLKNVMELQGFLLYSNTTGANLVHIVNEASTHVALVYMVLKRSPYRFRINEIVTRIVESGLYLKVYDNYLYKAKLNLLKIPSAENKIDFTMVELMFIFVLWSACMGFCTVVFLVEIVNKRMFTPKINNWC